MAEATGGMTAELYQAIVAVVDDRVREIRVTREDFHELAARITKEEIWNAYETDVGFGAMRRGVTIPDGTHRGVRA